MTFGPALAIVVAALDKAGVPHMIAGSVASTFYGEPRATQDIDLVVDPSTSADLREFVRGLDPERFYVGDHGEAFERRDMFNVIDMASGWKVDVIVRRDRHFSRTEFERRRSVELEGVGVYVASPEDVILSKLERAQMGGSERQLADVASVVAAVPDLDRDYLHNWAGRLGLLDELKRVIGA